MDERYDDGVEGRSTETGQESGDKPEERDDPGPILDGSHTATKRVSEDPTEATEAK